QMRRQPLVGRCLSEPEITIRVGYEATCARRRRGQRKERHCAGRRDTPDSTARPCSTLVIFNCVKGKPASAVAAGDEECRNNAVLGQRELSDLASHRNPPDLATGLVDHLLRPQRRIPESAIRPRSKREWSACPKLRRCPRRTDPPHHKQRRAT